ncbi:flagellar filament capping protein FliD [Thalassoglobus polymorphus]|uniref:Flagellar hook-associated protein 2 n=1 Tax=Thalassoglobus polymorphus TaxID=2527994 RepID=A0A517QNW6_9PLAN|nr:flagellar filament capping protein FliD [Thalassoglobus polymorphus]QDT33319.1 Flagellar hook-associated protein 2 [Thalassoglobus polymorphus]
MITIDGLITGIDTETIIDGLLEIQKNQIDRLQLRRQGIEAKQTAYESVEVQLVSLKSIADRLSRPQANVFQSRNVEVSEENAVFAIANTNASTGTYQIHIDSLARAHQVASTGFSETHSEITQGTLDIQVGDGDLKTITVDSSNNSLQSFVDAINNVKAGVTATLVNDGSASGTPHRILLTANKTGEANQITITNNLAASTGSATQPDFDFDNPVQSADDAQVRLGTGPGALTVQSASNEVKSLIQGVTLNLLAADSDQEVQIRVNPNTEPATTAINDLVDSYNAIMDFVDDLVRFNPETDQAGLLIGDRTVTDIQNEIRSAILDVVPEVGTSANRLSVLGISINNRSRLTINATRLEEVLAGRVDGITESDLQNLFAYNHLSTNPSAPTGIGTRLSQLIDGFTNIESGELGSVKESLLDQLTSLDNSIDRQQRIFDNQQQDLIAQFVALESSISELQTTSSFLSSQLSNLGKIGK